MLISACAVPTRCTRCPEAAQSARPVRAAGAAARMPSPSNRSEADRAPAPPTRSSAALLVHSPIGTSVSSGCAGWPMGEPRSSAQPREPLERLGHLAECPRELGPGPRSSRARGDPARQCSLRRRGSSHRSIPFTGGHGRSSPTRASQRVRAPAQDERTRKTVHRTLIVGTPRASQPDKAVRRLRADRRDRQCAWPAARRRPSEPLRSGGVACAPTKPTPPDIPTS